MDKEIAAALIALIGALIGGSITIAAQYYFNFKNQVKQREHVFKESRYKAITLLMYARVYPENLALITSQRPEIETLNDLDQELKAETFNLILFANDPVVISCKKFINQPTRDNFIQATIKMRKDLWGRKTKIDFDKLMMIDNILD